MINPWTTPGVLRTRRPWLQGARSLLLFGSTALNFVALQYLQLAESMSIMFATPLLVALLAGPALGERVGPRRLAAIAIGFLGVLVVTRPGSAPAPGGAPFDRGCGLLRLLQHQHAHARKPDSSRPPWCIRGWPGSRHDAASAVPLDHAGLAARLDPPRALGVFGAVGHWLLILAHARAPAPVLSPFIYTQILWMLVLGYLVFGDWPDVWTLLGSGIVIASGLYLLSRERGRQAERESRVTRGSERRSE